jgi:di- and tripeptidase
LQIRIGHCSDWWLANIQQCSLYSAAAEAVQEEWGVAPLLIREGGSIPAIPYLEKTFGACAVHVPLGQASDNAHLPNERIRLQNLSRGKAVLKRLLRKLSRHPHKGKAAVVDVKETSGRSINS